MINDIAEASLLYDFYGELLSKRQKQVMELYHEENDLPVISNPGSAGEPVSLDGNEYFVLGDNRNDSEDSRHADIGLIDKGSIIGKLWLRISPFQDFGTVK